MLGHIGYDNSNETGRPSPSVWRDCPHTILNDLSQGIYIFNDFLAVEPAAAATVATNLGPNLSFVGDTDTVISQLAGQVGGYVDLETDADDNDGGSIISEPFGKIVRNSGNKLWFETIVRLGDVTGDQGFFVGLVEEAGASQDVVADNAAALIGESLVGFASFTADPNALAAVYKKDAGTLVTVASDVTNSVALELADRASLVNDTDVKLGIRFNGRTALEFYVNGVKVATQEVDATVDQSKNLCAILALKTGAGAAESFASGWVKAASLLG